MVDTGQGTEPSPAYLSLELYLYGSGMCNALATFFSLPNEVGTDQRSPAPLTGYDEA